LAIERLSREPQVFVLERQRLQLLTEEKDLKDSDGSNFWDGSFLLDGALDEKGLSPDTINLTARLTPPKGGAPFVINVTGSRTNISEVIDHLTEKVLSGLKVSPSGAPWNAADEAEKFYEEADWALRWGLHAQAQAAAESAWALGKRHSDSAKLLVRTYVSSVSVQSFPQGKDIAPLSRALDILVQHAPVYFFSNSSAENNYSVAVATVRRTVEELESFYNAAEAREGHEQELNDLRSRLREAFTVVENHPNFSAGKTGNPNDSQQAFADLMWTEYGIACDQPEQAISFYRDRLNRGTTRAGLPRIIGWTWKDRQRASRLLDELVAEACASTNAATRLEGFCFNIFLAPEGVNHALEDAEQKLASGVLENREAFFHSENNALLRNVEFALAWRYRPFNLYSDVNREPFSTLRHRLRMDFLQSPWNTNLDVLFNLFGNTNIVAETPDQARELLPLVRAYQLKLPQPEVVSYLTNRLRPGKPWNSNFPTETTRPPEETVPAKFVRWDLKRPGILSDARVSFFGMVVRNGQIWTGVRYYTPPGGPEYNRITFLRIDPHSGVQDEIAFPPQFDAPSTSFDISSNALFVESEGLIHRYRFKEKVWDEIPVPAAGASGLVWMKDRLYISRPDSLIAVQPDSKATEVVASSRRNPATSEMDAHWTSDMLIYAQSDGRLGALNLAGCYTFDPATGHWNTRLLANGTNQYNYITTKLTSEAGSQWYISGPFPRRYVVGFWNGSQPCESLLMESSPHFGKFPIDEELLKPVRWDWPQEYPLEASDITAEDQRLWILCRRTPANAYNLVLNKPIQFKDNRTATLLYFDPAFRQAFTVGVKMEVTAPEMDPDGPKGLKYWVQQGIDQRWRTHIGNIDFWIKTPSDLVFATSFVPGHWLIPDATLKPIFEAQRKTFERLSASSPTKVERTSAP
jgi:hypothetical protein